MPAVKSSLPFRRELVDGTIIVHYHVLLACGHSVTATCKSSQRMRRGKIVDCSLCQLELPVTNTYPGLIGTSEAAQEVQEPEPYVEEHNGVNPEPSDFWDEPQPNED